MSNRAAFFVVVLLATVAVCDAALCSSYADRSACEGKTDGGVLCAWEKTCVKTKNDTGAPGVTAVGAPPPPAAPAPPAASSAPSRETLVVTLAALTLGLF